MIQTAEIRNVTRKILGSERRRHKRIPFSELIKIYDLSKSSKTAGIFLTAKIKDLGKGGIKITTLAPLERNSQIILQVNANKLKKLIPYNALLKITDNRLLAEIAWRKLNLDTGIFEAGVRFIEECERNDYQYTVDCAGAVP